MMEGIKSYLIPHDGRMVVMQYRLMPPVVGMSTGNWEYKPDYSAVWRFVKSPVIRQLLDDNKHPRDHEVFSVRFVPLPDPTE